MSVRSHRLKIEEKKLWQSLAKSAVLFILGGFLILYLGLPALAKIILFFSSSAKTETQNETSLVYLFPPSLEADFEATNSSKINLQGRGKSESTVKIFVNLEEQAKVQTDKDGIFLAKNISLRVGENSIYAVNILEKAESSPSSNLLIVYKKEMPRLEILNPKNEEKISGDSEEISITGETDQGNQITINDRQVIVDNSGKFSHTVRLNSGENFFKVKAFDNAGNQTEQELKVYR